MRWFRDDSFLNALARIWVGFGGKEKGIGGGEREKERERKREREISCILV